MICLRNKNGQDISSLISLSLLGPQPSLEPCPLITFAQVYDPCNPALHEYQIFSTPSIFQGLHPTGQGLPIWLWLIICFVNLTTVVYTHGALLNSAMTSWLQFELAYIDFTNVALILFVSCMHTVCLQPCMYLLLRLLERSEITRCFLLMKRRQQPGKVTWIITFGD